MRQFAVIGQQIDQRRFAHPRLTDDDGGFSGEACGQMIQAEAFAQKAFKPFVKHEIQPGAALQSDEALDAAAAGLAANRGTAYGMFSCSKATNEVNYLAQKFARVVMGSNDIDSCNRT